MHVYYIQIYSGIAIMAVSLAAKGYVIKRSGSEMIAKSQSQQNGLGYVSEILIYPCAQCILFYNPEIMYVFNQIDDFNSFGMSQCIHQF